MHSSLVTIVLAISAPLLTLTSAGPIPAIDSVSNPHSHALRSSNIRPHHSAHRGHRSFRSKKALAVAAGQPAHSLAKRERESARMRRIKRQSSDCDSDDDSSDSQTGSGSSNSSQLTSLPLTSSSSSSQGSTCTEGTWMCVGSALTRCDNSAWNTIANCTGENLVCSDDPKETGCIWSFDISNSTTSASNSSAFDNSTTSSDPSDSGSSTTASDPSASGNSTTASDPSSTGSSTTTGDDDDNDDDSDDCDDTDPTGTSANAPAPSASGNSTTTDDGDDGDDSGDDCDDEDPTSTSSSASDSATTAAPSSSTSGLGGNLLAQPSSTSTTSRHNHHHTSSSSEDASSTQNWDDSSASWTASSTDWSESWTTSSTDWSDQPSASASASASASDSWDDSDSDSSSAKVSPTSTKKSKNHATSTVSSSEASSSSGSGNSNGGGSNSGGSNGNWQAPHYVIYADDWLNSMPSVSQIGQYNRFILAFWMSDQGAVDDAEAWEQFDAGTRQQTLQEYHNAGIALMVSAFGSTDSPTSNGADPTQTAQNLASWVKKYGLDGVDIDYEDMDAMNGNSAEAWLITFQTELRNQLGSGYLISHAPVAPWFTSAPDYANGAYVAIHKAVGDTIDFYNVQFYNQGNNAYTTCETLINNSGSDWPDTSIMEINSSAGVPLSKIVLGKPNDAGAADNGYMDPSTLGQCVSQAQSQGWNGGVMFWEYEQQSASNLIATVLAAL